MTGVSRELLQRPLAVLAVQTTGLHPGKDQIWELALLLVEQGQVVARHHWLLDPGFTLPATVARLSAVVPAELDGQPRFAALAGELASRLQGRVVVGHNLRFALAFLRRAFALTALRPSFRQLCSEQLARRLLPDLPRHDLDTLCEALGIFRFMRHRALADAESTWQLLQQLQARVDDAEVRQQLRRAALPVHLQVADMQAVPERPGVYYFDGADALLYVGKSINLRRRVQSHFQNDHLSRRSLQMAQQVRAIRYRATAGELGALLLESAEVKRLQPLYNRQLRRQRGGFTWALRGAGSGITPQLLAPEQLVGAEPHAGLFRSRRQALEWLRQAAREHQLCLRLLGLETGGGACFAAQLGQCRGACCGRESRAQHDARLLAGCTRLRLAAWPWSGPVALVEHDARHDFRQWHVLDQWRHIATLDDQSEIPAALQQPRPAFSLDAYQILLGHLRRYPATEVVAL